MAIGAVGITGAIIFTVLAASIFDGEREISNSGGSTGVDQDDQKCEGCRNAKRKWKKWSRWKKARRAGWYVYKKAQCNLSGCPF